jgi:hypothetical protein
MKSIKDIVCDLELSKKLKELGLKKKSVFCFYDLNGTTDLEFYSPQIDWAEGVEEYNAYTVAELGEMLPDEIDDYLLNLEFMQNGDFCYTYTEVDECLNSLNNFNFCNLTKDQKEANARAKLLIWIIENKHVDVEELNNAT